MCIVETKFNLILGSFHIFDINNLIVDMSNISQHITITNTH